MVKKHAKYQQGDVLLFPVQEVQGKKINKKPLAEGEVTGHSHQVKGDYTMYEKDGVMYLKAESACTVVHEEHGTISINPGSYQIGIVREYDYALEEARQVRD
jgi:hypothetical protein